MYLTRHSRYLACIVALVVLSGVSVAQEASFRGVGQLTGFRGTEVAAVSADGRVIAGTAGNPASTAAQAFVWQGGLLHALGQIPGSSAGTIASTISSDGLVVTGCTGNYGAGPLWSWQDGSFVPATCPNLGCGFRAPVASPGDGSVWYYRDAFCIGTTRVSHDECEPLLALGSRCLVFSASDDGATLGVVVWINGNNELRGLLTGDGSFILPPWRFPNTGTPHVSRNGRFVWNEQEWWDRDSHRVADTANLTLASSATATGEQPISDTGVVVGEKGISQTQTTATIWSPGMYWCRRLDCALRLLGLGTAIEGWSLTSAIAISADGKTVIGQGVNPQGVQEGWVAVLPFVPLSPDFNEDRAVDFFDYDAFVTAFESGDPRADFDQDGAIDFFDYDSFVSAFELGC